MASLKIVIKSWGRSPDMTPKNSNSNIELSRRIFRQSLLSEGLIQCFYDCIQLSLDAKVQMMGSIDSFGCLRSYQDCHSSYGLLHLIMFDQCTSIDSLVHNQFIDSTSKMN